MLSAALMQAENSSWARIGIPAENGRIQAVAISPDGTLYAGSDDNGVFRSTDAGTTWTRANTGMGTANVLGLAVDPARSATVYAATLNGLFKTTDMGTTWVQSSIGLARTEILAVAVGPQPDATVYAGTDLGVYKSTDGGGTWTPASTGLPPIGVDALALVGATTLYAGTIDIHRPGAPTGAGVYKSSDAGGTWTAVNTGLGGAAVFSLAADPLAAATLFAAVPGGVYKTTTGGQTWNAVLNASVDTVAVDPTRTTTLFAGGFGAFHSADGGVTWIATNDGLADVNGVPPAVLSMAIDGSHRVYAGAGVGGNGVFRTTSLDVGTCTADPSTLCVGGARFQINVSWQVLAQGTGGPGHPSLLTADTGAFWFFTPNNVELVVKVVDGRAFNNRFWVFFGALSDVQYTITVRDTVTGRTRSYINAQGTLSSVADTNAFSP